MSILALLALCVATLVVAASDPQRIVGGSVTTISQYPSVVSVLRLRLGIYSHECGGTILNNRSILTSAFCTDNALLSDMRIRVGSAWANSGGVVHNVTGNILHPSYQFTTGDYSIAILRSGTTISFNNNVQPASIAGANYNLADNQSVWAAGWDLVFTGSAVGQLRHVELMVINQATCRNVLAQLHETLTDSMLCAGWPNGVRGQCNTGGPLFHNGVLVGVSIYGGCGWDPVHSVNTRITLASSWIQSNA